MALFAWAHLPYLLVNLVAPFRGILDPDYAGYSLGLIQLPKGIAVTLIVGFLVLICLFLMSRALMDRMNGLWTLAFLLDLLLVILVAAPLLIDILGNMDAFRVELGEDMQFSGFLVALLVFVVFTLPTGWACYTAARKMVSTKRIVASSKPGQESWSDT